MRRATERRRWVRVEPVPGGPASHARLRASGDVHVRDVASAGARVEGAVRLLPGARADLHLVGAAGRTLVRGRVVWARVRSLAPLVYEAAVAFDAPFDLLPGGYRLPGGIPTPAVGAAAGYPPAGLGPPDAGETAGNPRERAAGRAFGSSWSGGDRRDEQRAAR